MQIISTMTGCLFRILVVWVALLPGLQAAQQPREWAETHLDELLSYYHEFHSQPELSFREVETAARLRMQHW